MKKTIITRREIHDKMKLCKKVEAKKSCAIDYVLERLNINGLNPAEDGNIENRVTQYLKSEFFNVYFTKWASAHKSIPKFEEKHSAWLNAECKLSGILGKKPKASKGGRPIKPFEESSQRSQSRKTQQLRSEHSTAELMTALSKKLREEGNNAGALLIRECMATPTRSKEILQKWRNPEKPRVQLSDLVSLNLLKSARLSKRQYEMVRKATTEGLLAPYHRVRNMRESLYSFEMEESIINAPPEPIPIAPEPILTPTEKITVPPENLEYNNMYLSLNTPYTIMVSYPPGTSGMPLGDKMV